MQTPEVARSAFDVVRTIGLALPGVEAVLKYDGSPTLKLDGCFMAGLAGHRSAEHTLAVRIPLEERALLLEDAPETYYLTDYYRPHPVVLVRLSRIDREALRDLLSVSWRATSPKTGKRWSNRPGAAPSARAMPDLQSSRATEAVFEQLEDNGVSDDQAVEGRAIGQIRPMKVDVATIRQADESVALTGTQLHDPAAGRDASRTRRNSAMQCRALIVGVECGSSRVTHRRSSHEPAVLSVG
jgi:hypothetical protein